MIRKLDRNLIALFSALTIVACRGDDPGGTATESSTSSSSSESASSTVTPTTSDATSSTSDGTSSTSSTSTDPTTGACGGFIGCNTSTTGPSGPQPNGADCSSDADCESMNCYSNQLLMLSICAECNEDADCVAAGTGTTCNLDLGTQSIICTDGSNGATCMSDEACMSGHCDAVINIPIPGLLPDTCGECSSSADCTAPDICSPNFDFQAFSGQKICVAPGSVENNNLCPEGAEGDLACMSGHCTMATIMGIVPVNICGECASDADCAMGQTCMAAEASMNGLNGSTCV